MSVQQPPQVPTPDEGGSKYESIKIEKNSRGYNYSVRVVKQEGQSDRDWLARLDYLNNEMHRRYGQG